MQSCTQCSPPTHPPSSPPPSVFSPAFLARLREHDEAPTATEAELSGPWRTEAVPGRPGRVAVLRAWESLDHGDVPRAVFDKEETARLYALGLPALGREPLYHLREEAGPDGYPVAAVDGENGPCRCGALARHEPETLDMLHLLETLIRTPTALAGLLEIAGPGAVAQVGRILAERWGVGR